MQGWCVREHLNAGVVCEHLNAGVVCEHLNAGWCVST